MNPINFERLFCIVPLLIIFSITLSIQATEIQQSYRNQTLLNLKSNNYFKSYIDSTQKKSVSTTSARNGHFKLGSSSQSPKSRFTHNGRQRHQEDFISNHFSFNSFLNNWFFLSDFSSSNDAIDDNTRLFDWRCDGHRRDYGFLLRPSASRVVSRQLMEILDSNRGASGTANVVSNLEQHFCSILIVFSDRCPFSKRSIPVFNALSRLYTNINFFAIHVNEYWMFRWTMSTFYVPSIKFYSTNRKRHDYYGNDTSLEELVDSVHRITGQLPIPGAELRVKAQDHNGPIFVSSLDLVYSDDVDYLLFVSWALTLICAAYLIHYANLVDVFLRVNKFSNYVRVHVLSALFGQPAVAGGRPVMVRRWQTPALPAPLPPN